jgi:hypothetical protein
MSNAFCVGEYKSVKNQKKTIFDHIKSLESLTKNYQKCITGGMHLLQVADNAVNHIWNNRSHWYDGTHIHKFKRDVTEHTGTSATNDTKILFTSGNAARITPLNHFDLFQCGDNITHNEAKRLSSDSDEFGDCIIVLNKTLFERMGVQVLIKDQAVIGVFPTANGTFELPAGYYAGSVSFLVLSRGSHHTSFIYRGSHNTLPYAQINRVYDHFVNFLPKEHSFVTDVTVNLNFTATFKLAISGLPGGNLFSRADDRAINFHADVFLNNRSNDGFSEHTDLVMMMNIAMAKNFGGYYFDTIPDDLYDEIKVIYGPQIVFKGINDGIQHFSPASIDNDALVQYWPRSTSTMCLLQVWMGTMETSAYLTLTLMGTSGLPRTDCQAHPRSSSGRKNKRSCPRPPRHRRGTSPCSSKHAVYNDYNDNQHNQPT